MCGNIPDTKCCVSPPTTCVPMGGEFTFKCSAYDSWADITQIYTVPVGQFCWEDGLPKLPNCAECNGEDADDLTVHVHDTEGTECIIDMKKSPGM